MQTGARVRISFRSLGTVSSSLRSRYVMIVESSIERIVRARTAPASRCLPLCRMRLDCRGGGGARADLVGSATPIHRASSASSTESHTESRASSERRHAWQVQSTSGSWRSGRCSRITTIALSSSAGRSINLIDSARVVQLALARKHRPHPSSDVDSSLAVAPAAQLQLQRVESDVEAAAAADQRAVPRMIISPDSNYSSGDTITSGVVLCFAAAGLRPAPSGRGPRVATAGGRVIWRPGPRAACCRVTFLLRDCALFTFFYQLALFCMRPPSVTRRRGNTLGSSAGRRG
jgi:hypothetical protein